MADDEKFYLADEKRFQFWFHSYWKFGSSTDELRARRAWIMARGNFEEMERFYEEHPELKLIIDE